MEAKELLPCPFCGEQAEIRVTEHDTAMWTATGKPRSYRPFCMSCDCTLQNGWFRERDAVDAWNRRPSSGNSGEKK